MKIDKSTRHHKIIGNFGENLVCNWLSRSGFEVGILDHTGLDIVAYNPVTKQRLGITVKSRTRNEGTEIDSVNILSFRKENDDRKKLMLACKAFNCEPWIAVYVETLKDANLYMTSLKNYEKKYKSENSFKVADWKMRDKDVIKYKKDCNVKHIKIEFKEQHWEW